MSKEDQIASARLLLAQHEGKTEKRAVKLDSWVNSNSGFGIQHQTNQTEFFKQIKKSQDELTSLYEDNWVISKGIDMYAEDMTRKGVKFQHNDEDENSVKIVDTLDDILRNEYNWLTIAAEAIKFSSLTGGTATFFNFGGTTEDQRDPIDESQIREIRSIRNFPAWLATPVSWYTEFGHPKEGQPEHYQLIYRDPSSGKVVTCHESRLIILQGRSVTPSTKAFNRGWNNSIVQSIYNAVRDFGVSTSSASGIMESFNWSSLGIKGLADRVMHDPEDLIMERVFLANQKLHHGNLSLYDAEGETMERHGTPVTGLADLMDRFKDINSAALRIPRTLLYGAEAGNLGGNSSDADSANYFDRVGSAQELELRPWYNRFIKFVSIVNGISDEEVRYIFNPLGVKTDKEKYEERKFVAETDKVYIDTGVVTPMEVAKSRFSKPEIDLDSMDIDLEERDKQEELAASNQENEELIKQLEIDSMEIDNKNKKDEGSEPKKEEKKVEKKDSAPTINVKVDAPIVNVPEIPVPKDYSDILTKLEAKMDKLEAQNNEVSTIVIE